MQVSVDGAELHCTVQGRGPACLVPSAIGTAPYERQMARGLLDHLTMVYVDLRGGGRSTGRATDLTFDVVAADVDAIRAALGVERVILLGHSILGLLALECARRLPAAVSHVVTVGTPPYGDMDAVSARSAAMFEAEADSARTQRLRHNLAALPPDASAAQTLLAQTPMRFCDPTVDAAPHFEGAVSRPELVMHIIGTLAAGWTVTADLESLTVPVLITHGRWDYTVPHTMWDGIPNALPDATFHRFEASGHQPFFEEPERFAAVVTEWLAGRRPPH